MKNNILGLSLFSLNKYIYSYQRLNILIITLFTFVISVLDVIGLAAIVPVTLVFSDVSIVKSNKFLNLIFVSFGFEDIKYFILCLLILLLGFFLLKNIFASWVLFMQSKFITEISSNVVMSQLDKFSGMPLWEFNNMGSSILLSSTLQIPSNYINGIVRPLFAFINEVMIVLIIVLGIFLFKPVLFLVLLVFLAPSVFLIYRVFKNKSESLGDKILELRPVSFNVLSNIFNGFLELKLANKLNMMKGRLVENEKKLHMLESRAYVYQGLPLRIIELVAIIGLVIIFIYGIYFSSDPKETIALLGLFAASSYRLMPSINRMLTSVVTMKTYKSAIDELLYNYDNIYSKKSISSNDLKHKEQAELTFESELILDRISFSFPGYDKNALNNINLRIKKGEIIGFIGSSGSGKTTLMNLILRFYIENEGAILVDGLTLDESRTKAWYQSVGYVKQDTFLMDASIRENITLYDENIDENRLTYAIKQASLLSLIESLPSGDRTHIGEKGSKLSGGQRQRIGIARALYKNANVLVLDEATSALDNETEREVNESIHTLSLTDITVLIVAHRITTLRDCNRIYELKDGYIIAEHQYNQLAEKLLQ
ncbi:ABC transporter ATP-binding protein [Hymenobacter lutimineralis]|nr:ABC transporter ATP-binding protein/permease [Hymenobacter lutimineralis]